MERYDPSTFYRGDADGFIEYPAARIASATWHGPRSSRVVAIGLDRIRVAGDRRPCEDILAGRLLHLAPLRRRDAHVALERALERRFGLIADSLRHGAG
jgi:hypothetical protein